MPRWNLGEIISDVTNRVGRNDIPNSVLSRYANQAYLDVVAMTDPSAHERIAVSSTTSGENRLQLPADFLSPLGLSFLTRVGSRRTLLPITAEQADATGFSPLGVPDSYVLYGNWMELYPSPNSAWSIQLRYRSFATSLIASTDVPSLSTAWRFPVVLKAQSYLHGWLHESNEEARANDAFLRHVSALDTDKGNRQAGMRVRVVYGNNTGLRRGRRNQDFDTC